MTGRVAVVAIGSSLGSRQAQGLVSAQQQVLLLKSSPWNRTTREMVMAPVKRADLLGAFSLCTRTTGPRPRAT